MNALGTHLILELQGCDREFLNDLTFVEASMVDAAHAVGATIVGRCFHHFDPIGVTGVVAIAESHLTIHTWPEYGYAAADIFACGGTIDPQVAARLLIDRFGAKSVSVTELQRGVLTEAASGVRS